MNDIIAASNALCKLLWSHFNLFNEQTSPDIELPPPPVRASGDGPLRPGRASRHTDVNDKSRLAFLHARWA